MDLTGYHDNCVEIVTVPLKDSYVDVRSRTSVFPQSPLAVHNCDLLDGKSRIGPQIAQTLANHFTTCVDFGSDHSQGDSSLIRMPQQVDESCFKLGLPRPGAFPRPVSAKGLRRLHTSLVTPRRALSKQEFLQW